MPVDFGLNHRAMDASLPNRVKRANQIATDRRERVAQATGGWL